MGDVGSAFLGYTFAAMPFLARAMTDADASPRLPLIAVLFVWPFVFDTALTFLRRLVRREHVFSAHRSHLYQRLVIAGYRHSTVTLLYLGLACVGGVVALVGRPLPILSVPILAAGLWGFVRRAEIRASITKKLA
jgi:UDP-N-acetylmuramyl pentapeptide phosphotransferase/UDP-N-acetylglucosamine-1-phosphate transferase